MVPDMQKGAERFAGRNVEFKGEERVHGHALQSTKPAFILFRTVMQVLIPLLFRIHVL